MARRKRRKFSEEFKQEAVRLCQKGDRSIGEVAREMDLTESALRNWVKQAEADQGKGPSETLTSAEKEELQRLRKENKRLREEKLILKKAAAFFAKENE
jgi:transposase